MTDTNDAAIFSVEQLYKNHIDKIQCGFCSHTPEGDDGGCWCPICINEMQDKGMLAPVDDIDTYLIDCLMHGVAPAHTDGRSDDTCTRCRPIRAAIETDLKWIHARSIRCAYCSHEPNADNEGCWCPQCIREEEADHYYSVGDIDVYTRMCLLHGMAPPHFDGSKEETCGICQNADAS